MDFSDAAGGAQMEFGLLGPLLVRDGEATVPIPPGNQRVLLAALLLNANTTVSGDALTEIIWPVHPPPSARVTLYNYVKRLRLALGDAGHSLVTTQPRGYLIRVQPDALDIARFEGHRDEARQAARAGSWERAAHLFHSALGQWRGEPLADVRSDSLMVREIPRLQEMRLQALEERIEADLHLGRAGDVVVELKQMVAAHPLRERFHALLLLALYRCGRQGEALAAYQSARRLTLDELGVEPGRQLRELQSRILAGDPGLTLDTLTSGGAVTGSVPPARPAAAAQAIVARQLPPAVPHFACRAGEQAELSGLLRAPGESGVVVTICGTAGVGKSALAVYWAHRVADHFTDGQLFVNLRGFGPSRLAVSPAKAIRWLLDGLGVPPRRQPSDLESQVALYRSLLADRKVLIVLDNARDCEHVRPLLPGAPGCLVIVTSRSELTGLATTEGAHPLVLSLLTPADSRELLAGRLGVDRLAREAGAAADLAGLCAGLPLALSVVAAQAATRSWLTLASQASELRARDRLDALETGDAASNIRAVFSWSCRNLSPPAARLFRLIGVHCGPDITGPAAASLAGVGHRRARSLLDELSSASLISEHAPGRFSCHDLLRAFAAEQARVREGPGEIGLAIHRALDHYLHTARSAALLLYPGRDPIDIEPAAAGAAPERLAGHSEALAWCQEERHVLLAAISQAAALGLDRHAWQIPWTLAAYFDLQGHWDSWATSQQIALEAATRLGDQVALARAHRSAGDALGRLGRYGDALAHLRMALALYRDVGDQAGQARSHSDIAWVCELRGHNTAALRHGRQAHAAYQAAGHRFGQARTLTLIGWYHVLCGHHLRAVSYCEQALALHRQLGLGNRHTEAETLESLGCARSGLGQHSEAIACLERALALRRDCGDQVGEAETLERLGDACRSAGDPSAARDAWARAQALLDRFGDPRLDKLRAKLAGLPSATRG